MELSGAGSERFLRNLKELDKLYKPDIIAILEPRISGQVANIVCKRVGKENWIRVEANGFNGGIWVLWDGAWVELRVVHFQKQLIHLVVNPGSMEE